MVGADEVGAKIGDLENVSIGSMIRRLTMKILNLRPT